MFKLLERIAALPEAEQYLDTQPDINGEAAYDERLAEIYAYVEEAPAIREEYKVFFYTEHLSFAYST